MVGECGAFFELKEDVIACVHELAAFHVPRRRGFEMIPSSTFQDLFFNSTIPNKDRNEREERIARYTSTTKLLVNDVDKRGNLCHVRYWALLNTWIGWITEAIRSEEPYGQKVLILKTGGCVLITGYNFLQRMRHMYFKHRRGRNPRYFLIVNGLKECLIWIARVSQNYGFYSNE